MSKERDSKQRIVFVQLFAEAAASSVPDEIHIVPTGKWDHPVYGEMEITSADIAEFVQNFNRGIRRDIPITAGHDNGMSGGELPAIGWFTELIDRGNAGLYGGVKWTEEGKQLLTNGSFKYFSPEFYEQYADPETGTKYGHVLVGGALTNKPYFKELDPVATFSEPGIIETVNEPMNLKTILGEKASELSEEEKAFVRSHKEALDDAQKTAFASVFDENGGEAADGEDKEGKDDGGSDEDTEAGGAAVEASEKNIVKISATEYAALKDKADKGHKAFAEIEKMKLEREVDRLIFSASNKDGRILPKGKDAVVAFMVTLSEKQRDQFRNIVNSLPKQNLFNEIGDGGKQRAATKADEVDALVQDKIKASEGKMAYSVALKAVLRENAKLASEYNAEQSGETSESEE